MKLRYFAGIAAIFLINFGSAAHYIVGYVGDSSDGLSFADGREVVVWNPANISAGNVTDIVGPSGNSGTNNIYLIDCELLSTPCNVGDILTVDLVSDGSEYNSRGAINVTVTGEGFDLANNLSMNSPIQIESIILEDALLAPLNELDLLTANILNVSCNAVINDSDGETDLRNISSKVYLSSYSFESPDDNNNHYTNDSCLINYSFGNNLQTAINCSYQIEYYADPGSWKCNLSMIDNLSTNKYFSDSSSVNQLLSIGIDSPLNYGLITTNVSSEKTLNITNYGNVQINLSVYGYGQALNDNLSFVCNTGSNNITVGHQKYNLSSSTPGELNYTNFSEFYINLTSESVVKNFSLNYRQNDITNEAIKSSYWRTYVPEGINGSCSGNIVFGATTANGA